MGESCAPDTMPSKGDASAAMADDTREDVRGLSCTDDLCKKISLLVKWSKLYRGLLRVKLHCMHPSQHLPIQPTLEDVHCLMNAILP